MISIRVGAVLVTWCLWAATAAAESEEERLAGTYTGDTGTITVSAAGGGKVSAFFDLQALGSPNSGQTRGTTTIKNGSGVIVDAELPQCSLALKFSGNVLRVVQAGSSSDCGFGANVTANGDYARSARSPAAAPTPTPNVVPGAPSEAQCKAANAARPARGSTQLAINEAEGLKAIKAACALRAPYLKLEKEAKDSKKAKSGAAEALRVAQVAWEQYLQAHARERYPHESESGYYGSMLPACRASEEQLMFKARTKELSSFRACSAASSAASKAEAQRRDADAERVAAVGLLQSLYAKDPVFLAALAQAEKAYDEVIRAQVTYVAATSGAKADASTCAVQERTRAVRERIGQLKNWLKKSPVEGDSCAGSYVRP